MTTPATSDPTFDAVLGGLGSSAVTALKVTLAEAWDAFSEQERTDCERLMVTLAKARLYELAGYDVSDHLKTLQVAFEQWQVVGKQVAIDAVKSAAAEVFGLGGAFVASALATFLKNA